MSHYICVTLFRALVTSTFLHVSHSTIYAEHSVTEEHFTGEDTERI
jgi:hypothetical protein